MDSLLEKICRFRKIEAEDAKKARKFEKCVGIDPDTYIAKEILYQTAELKAIRLELSEIKKIIKK